MMEAIILIITIVTGPHAQNKMYQVPMPSIDACFDQAREFAHTPKDKLPADMTEDMQGRIVSCKVKEGAEEHS